MLPVITATEYHRRMGSGKSRPIMLGAEDDDGVSKLVVVKLPHLMEQGGLGLIAEAMAAMLARDLSLRAPSPYLVRLGEAFINSIPEPEAATDLQRAMPLTFGTEFVKGLVPLRTAEGMPGPLLEQAADIFAFDVIVDNSDRYGGNPNCYSDGDQILILDHELTFLFGILGWRPPWEEGALELWKRGVPHVFFSGIRSHGLTLDGLEARLNAIPLERCDEYEAALPDEWRTNFKDGVSKMVGFVRNLLLNKEATMRELRRVLQNEN